MSDIFWRQRYDGAIPPLLCGTSSKKDCIVTSVRTVGNAVLASLAIPAGGISFLGAAGSLLALTLSPSSRTSGVFLFFLATAGLLGATLYFLAAQQKRGKQLVARINAREGLRLDATNMLGYPSPAFFVFDRGSRKLAACDMSSGQYVVHDATYILGWHYTWTNRESVEMIGAGNRVGESRLHAPAFERVERRVNFRLVLEVANPVRPMLAFPMPERAAIEWCARLNAILNG